MEKFLDDELKLENGGLLDWNCRSNKRINVYRGIGLHLRDDNLMLKEVRLRGSRKKRAGL